MRGLTDREIKESTRDQDNHNRITIKKKKEKKPPGKNFNYYLFYYFNNIVMLPICRYGFINTVALEWASVPHVHMPEKVKQNMEIGGLKVKQLPELERLGCF